MSGGQLDLGLGGPPRPGLDPRVRFGTSSFAWDDWVGPFYPPGTRPADYLRVYATRFDCVEVDSTYYRTPTSRTVDGWAEKTPASFRLAAKFPRAIVHAGEGALPDAARLLTPEATDPERDRFLAVMERLGERLGPLVLQFPYFSKKCFPSAEPFLERLDRFLEKLPAAHRYAVEIRNPRWLGPPLLDLCRRHRAALVLVDHEWMPHGDTVARELDFLTTDFCYVRLLGDRTKIEALTTTWEREVIDRSASLGRWADLLRQLAAENILTWIFINNHYAGHAPATVRALEALYRAGLGGGPGGPPAGEQGGRPGGAPGNTPGGSLPTSSAP